MHAPDLATDRLSGEPRVPDSATTKLITRLLPAGEARRKVIGTVRGYLK
jgi:hypothetical protein